MTVPFPHSPKPVQGRPFGENLHRGLHSCPCRGRKSPEIQEVIISRKALKIRCPQGRPGSNPGPGTESFRLVTERGGVVAEVGADPALWLNCTRSPTGRRSRRFGPPS